MISKELLSEMLKKDVIKHSLLNKSTNNINVTYYPHEDMHHTDYIPINIYELANKCKKWAFKEHDYSIGSWIQYGNWYCDVRRNSINGARQTETNADTEPEVIFKACEWILKEANA